MRMQSATPSFNNLDVFMMTNDDDAAVPCAPLRVLLSVISTEIKAFATVLNP